MPADPGAVLDRQLFHTSQLHAARRVYGERSARVVNNALHILVMSNRMAYATRVGLGSALCCMGLPLVVLLRSEVPNRHACFELVPLPRERSVEPCVRYDSRLLAMNGSKTSDA